jgi:hypothetical protein
MSRWKSVKARQLLAAFPGLLAQIAKKTGLQPEDL